ncbi:NAD(P)/FAD-dependent oxidoreductase [Asticcacaulis solisilvae]|uniref:NAD(P)/FAD-dependent oxidoreductase n=1 Tax=Asticcacaulis solisilvae TaxID=1217274 RepID=UPI003FD81313
MQNTGHPEGSWYRATVNAPPVRPRLEDELSVEVGIVGGGYTGLGAALELAAKGVRVALLEGADIGSGASGRNGGQIHTGQRVDPETLSTQLGADAARQLWDMAEDAKASLYDLVARHGIDCELKSGLIHAWHKPHFAKDDSAYADFVRREYGYDKVSLLDRNAVAAELGTDVYHGGIYDAGGGHLHPLKLALGMARATEDVGASLFEQSRVLRIDTAGARPVLHTQHGRLTCDTVLLCGNGYMEGLDGTVDARVMPINNFILVTEPLDDPAVLPRDVAAADSRFVVNYWRKTPDNRLLFGGGENYTPWFPKDIAGMVRRNMLKIYPQLADAAVTHAWGGTLAITLSRAPFVRRLSRNVLVSAGYSGQGVVLAPYFGKLLARAVMGDTRDIELLSRLPTPAFFGGRFLRWPALVTGLSYYALRDRL